MTCTLRGSVSTWGSQASISCTYTAEAGDILFAVGGSPYYNNKYAEGISFSTETKRIANIGQRPNYAAISVVSGNGTATMSFAGSGSYSLYMSVYGVHV